MHTSPPFNHSNDDALTEVQPLTSGAARSPIEAQRPATSYSEQHSNSEPFPTFDRSLDPSTSPDWPLRNQRPSTSYSQQYDSSTPFLRYQQPTGPSSPLQDQRPSTSYPLPRSPSTPIFESHQSSTPSAVTSSPSAPDLRVQPVKKRFLGKFKGGVENFFRRDQKQSKNKGLVISGPYDFEHKATMTPQKVAKMTGPVQEASVVEQVNELTVGSTQAAPSPSPPHLEQSARGEEDLLPAQREALRLGLEINYGSVHRMNTESAASDRVVRQYEDLGSDFYASRAAKPVYDGKAIANSGAGASSSTTLEPVGQWHCCKCDYVQDLFKHDQGDHLVTVLYCTCPHRSCDNCSLTGDIKLYKPVQEPIPVQLSDDEQKQVLFGVFCGNCGLSWRAQEIKNSVIDKISAVPKDLAKLGAAPLDKLRSSRSMHNLRGEASGSATKSTLNLRALSNEMEKEHGKQANHVLVKFSGIQCSCGNTLGTSSLCCQIVESKEEKAPVQEPVVVKKEPTFTATPEDRAKGIGKSTLTVEVKGKRVRHANPLMSNPV